MSVHLSFMKSSKPVHIQCPSQDLRVTWKYWFPARLFPWGMVTLKALHCIDRSILIGTCQKYLLEAHSSGLLGHLC